MQELKTQSSGIDQMAYGGKENSSRGSFSTSRNSPGSLISTSLEMAPNGEKIGKKSGMTTLPDANKACATSNSADDSFFLIDVFHSE
ncbi:LOW QUALITY PROTEIN: hypothetical protein PSENEW3_00004817 [Picochlorum sp. SENEW3]|nr:LOW QUALITY PROTEIN: hypothetical protein PSENEW3_00004817 [Picochlorum sp. SENEW3]